MRTMVIAVTLLAMALVPLAADPVEHQAALADNLSVEINVLETMGVWHAKSTISLTMADGGGLFAVQNNMSMCGNAPFTVGIEAGDDIGNIPDDVVLYALVDPGIPILGNEGANWLPSPGDCYRLAGNIESPPGDVGGCSAWASWSNESGKGSGNANIASFALPDTGDIKAVEVPIIYGIVPSPWQPRVTDPEERPTVTLVFTITGM